MKGRVEGEGGGSVVDSGAAGVEILRFDGLGCAKRR